MTKLTSPQMDVLRALDGATAPVEFNGTYARTLKSLREKGMVKYARRTKSFRIGTFPYHGSNVYFDVSLTNFGWEFIHWGGLDH